MVLQTNVDQARLDNEIMLCETRYLEETTAGNIIRGFDNYIKGATGTSAVTTGGTSTRRRAGISDQDRIFSRSSVSVSRVRAAIAYLRHDCNG